MKKIISLILAALMAGTLAVNAFAIDTITIEGGTHDCISAYGDNVQIVGDVVIKDGGYFYLTHGGTICITKDSSLKGKNLSFWVTGNSNKIYIENGGSLDISIPYDSIVNNFAAFLDDNDIEYKIINGNEIIAGDILTAASTFSNGSVWIVAAVGAVAVIAVAAVVIAKKKKKE